jgi:C-terminal processing protease CtpA/Prc
MKNNLWIVIFLSIQCAVWAVEPLKGHIEKQNVQKGRIGILFDGAGPRVLKVYVGSPAYVAGIKPGDYILSHSDKDIIGPVGTNVTLLVLHAGRRYLIVIERVPFSQIDKSRFIE